MENLIALYLLYHTYFTGRFPSMSHFLFRRSSTGLKKKVRSSRKFISDDDRESTHIWKENRRPVGLRSDSRLKTNEILQSILKFLSRTAHLSISELEDTLEGRLRVGKVFLCLYVNLKGICSRARFVQTHLTSFYKKTKSRTFVQ